MTQIIILEQHEGKQLHVLQDSIRLLINGTETGGHYELFELAGPLGSGPPMHRHPWDESYYLLEGEIEIRCDKRTNRLTPGGFAFVRANAPHTYRIQSETARFLLLTSTHAASLFLSAMHNEIGKTPESFEAVVAVAKRQGVTLA